MNGKAGWYHMPVSTSAKKKYSRTIMREIRYCAIAVHHAGSKERLIEHLYDVKSVKLLKRCQLEVEQAGSLDPGNKNEYWLFELGTARELVTPVIVGDIRTFRSCLTDASDLLASRNWIDLPKRYEAFIG